MTQEKTVDPNRPGHRAFTLVVVANAISLAATIALIVILLAVAPNGLGGFNTGDLLFGFIAVPRDTVFVFIAVFALQIVLAIIGTVGLILAIVAAVKNRGRGRAVAAIVIALVVPVLSFLAFSAITASRVWIR